MKYIIHDHDLELKKRGALHVADDEADIRNEECYGVFWTPNEFEGDRKAVNLTKINFWYVDIDSGEKPTMLNQLLTAILKPTLIVETKKGYHAYWHALDATPENFQLVARGLIEKFNGDPACKDVCRLLRVPGFWHCKDPTDKFMIKYVFDQDKSYSEAKMLICFPIKKPKIAKLDYKGDNADLIDEKNWDRIFKLNRIGNGSRNNEFSKIAFWLRDAGFSESVVLNTIQRMNMTLPDPLDNREIEKIVGSKY